MKPPFQVTRGVRILKRLLREQTCDLRSLDLAGFRGWLDAQHLRWQNDPVFLQRTAIRDLKRTHPELRLLEKEHHRAAVADAASPQSSRLRSLEQELLNTTRAISGLTAALARAAADRRSALGAKLEAFQSRQQVLREEQASLLRSSSERQALLQSDAQLRELHTALGLDREEARLESLLKQQGRRSERSGSSFEELALPLTERYLVPALLRGRRQAETRQRLRVLRGVTLGAVRTEFDQLVVRLPRKLTQPAEVLAVVEVKRNPNDLAHGFLLRQENLTWLTGDASHYDPARHRTRYFRSGHFDREVVHEQDGERFLLARASFRHFRRDSDTGWFLKRLYFIARGGPLWGVSTAALARIAFRVATDRHWEPESDGYLGRLLEWCRGLTNATETPDVLRLYAANPRQARRILLCESTR